MNSDLRIAAAEIVARTRREQHLPPTICDPAVLERLAVLIGRGGAEVPQARATLPGACAPETAAGAKYE